ncbi:MAG TPA: radical SAM protein, partial [Candidatus Margulisiibacteriota bacterium]|nr:radical SAM protein [Candidatus Margulisiibacteriota bacterium]
MDTDNFKGEKSLLNQDMPYIRAEKARYLYLCVTSTMPHGISIWWEVNKNKYVTKETYLHTTPAVYRFDLAILRAAGPSGKWGYYWDGKISGFGVKSSEDCQIKWLKFSNSRINFDDRFPLICMIDYPEVIHFEVTRNCNLNCYMCRKNREREVRKIGVPNLDYGIFEKTIPFARHINNVAFFGWGEPLVHPQFHKFIDAIDRIKDRNDPSLANRQKPYVNFTSNATLLTEDMIRRLIKQGLNEIVVSIDSQDPSNYNFIRENADFKEVISNLQNLKRIKQ